MSARDLIATPGQTVGPFFHDALPFPGTASWSAPDAPTPYACTGRCSTAPATLSPTPSSSCGRRTPTAGSCREPGSLRRDGFTFTGWGRAATDDAGHYSFSTVRPGPVVAGSAPFFALTVFARGLPNRLFTRAYLPADDAARSADPLLSAVEEGRRSTLVAVPDAQGFRFDIRLQGEGETVFLTYPRH